PEKNIDLGLPEDMSDVPDEIDIEPGETSHSNADIEDIILSLLEELDTDGKGAPRDELERRAESEGISSMELEEISNVLMDKGLVYEPNLRYLKRI
ncbi:MAG: glycerol dehydrogenase, partial [Candidatus Methanoplasma sp.]|nr:glycerol dehydrogenase [Candidatus Methanoplasma sp.]